METIIFIAIGLFIGLFGAWFVFSRRGKNEDTKGDSFLLLQNQLSELTRTIDHKLGESSRFIDQKLSESSRSMLEAERSRFGDTQRIMGDTQKLIKEITEELTHVKETSRQVVGFADQLQSLQDILKNPKQRGVLGEYYLETLLKNVLSPNNYKMQYAFANGEIVDAAVFVKDKIIPIDSKFSLENYNRLAEARDPLEKERFEKLFVNDLKNRIQETSKYIRPEEGTMDFAFMFIPHEAIYYDLLVNKIGLVSDDTENLIQRAAGKYKVLIVSPTSFLAYLQTVLQGLKALQIEETAKDIINNVGVLAKHLKKYEEYHKKLGNSLGTVVNHFNTTDQEFRKIDKDVIRITGEGVGVEPLTVEKPLLED